MYFEKLLQPTPTHLKNACLTATMPWEREQLFLAFDTWSQQAIKKSRTFEQIAISQGRKCTLRHYLKVWSSYIPLRKFFLYQIENLALLQRDNSTLRQAFIPWHIFCRSRGRLIRTARTCWSIWTKIVTSQRADRRLIDRAKVSIQACRIFFCLELWKKSIYQILLLHGYQLHRLCKYIRYSRILWFPHPWIQSSQKLMTISLWKLVRSCCVFYDYIVFSDLCRRNYILKLNILVRSGKIMLYDRRIIIFNQILDYIS